MRIGHGDHGIIAYGYQRRYASPNSLELDIVQTPWLGDRYISGGFAKYLLDLGSNQVRRFLN